jgi:hypothetical protein
MSSLAPETDRPPDPRRSAPFPKDGLLAASRSLRSFVEHPMTKLIVGLVLILSGFNEAYEGFFDDIRHHRFGTRHGRIVPGFVNVLSSLPTLVEFRE